MKTDTLPVLAIRARKLGFVAWTALVLLQVAWHGLVATPFDGKVLTLALVPLLLPLLAMRRPTRALLWTGIIALFYFAHGVSDAWTLPETRIWALLEVALSVILIGALGVAFPKRPKQPASR
ncbi:MAG TPA: DUF2069 domain-containing protein [Rhodanobacteraceae bacterium]